jgi:hypothetical protein
MIDHCLHLRWLAGVSVVAALGAAGIAFAPASAQQSEPLPPTYAQMRYNSGQSVQPVFEGWNKNADGSFNLVFGYYNRNVVEQPSVPIGVNNNFSPGVQDRGQPTFFYARLNRFVFQVAVPADFGNSQLIWSVGVNGQTERAIGSLGREWEIENRWDFGGGGSSANTPPALSVPAALSATAGSALTLSATIADDGNPPAPAAGGRIVNQGQDAFPTLHKGVKGPVNVPMLPPMPRAPGGALSAGWILYRGPAAAQISPVNFQRLADRRGGHASAVVTFPVSGTYVLRAEASDGRLHDVRMVTVTVTGATPNTGR